MLVAGALLLLCLLGDARAAGCTDNWKNADGGAWSNADNWSKGVPGATDTACITLAGNYTVTLEGRRAIASLVLGSSSGDTTQKLVIQRVPDGSSTLSFTSASTIDKTGELDLDGGGFANLQRAAATITNNGKVVAVNDGTNTDLIEASIVNAAQGTVEIASADVVQDTGTTTNHGDLIVDVGARLNLTGNATLTNQPDGTMTFLIAGAASFGAVDISSDSTFQVAGGSALPVLVGGYSPPLGQEFEVIVGRHGGTFANVLNSFHDDSANAGFIGLVRDRDNTVTSVASSVNPSTFGQKVTFTATITTGADPIANPTGTVAFSDGATQLGTGSVSTSGAVTTATISITSPLEVGFHTITATYSGDANFQPSPASSPLSEEVDPASGGSGPQGGTGPQGGKVLGASVRGPVFRRSANVTPIRGVVRVRLRGSRVFVRITALQQIPLGATIDATNGTVQVVLARRGGGTMTGQYFRGEFVLSQLRSGAAIARLVGGDFSSCAGRRGPHAVAGIARRKPRRQLWSNVHGSFTTQGGSASGTVRGTEWLTEDFCDGTNVRVVRGVVLVTDLVRHRSRKVSAGHSYFVRA